MSEHLACDCQLCRIARCLPKVGYIAYLGISAKKAERLGISEAVYVWGEHLASYRDYINEKTPGGLCRRCELVSWARKRRELRRYLMDIALARKQSWTATTLRRYRY